MQVRITHGRENPLGFQVRELCGDRSELVDGLFESLGLIIVLLRHRARLSFLQLPQPRRRLCVCGGVPSASRACIKFESLSICMFTRMGMD